MRFQVLATAFFLFLPFLPSSSTAAQSAASQSGAAAETPGYVSDPKFSAAMADAKKLIHEHQYSFAADAYKKANKIAGGKCLECLSNLYNIQMGLKSYKDAGNSAAALEELASTPLGKSNAEYRRADAIYESGGDKPKQAQLEAAHGLLQEALGNYPKNAAVLFLDGKVLARMGKLDDAKAEFGQCVSCVKPTDPARLRAEHFAEDPELSLHKMAPSFEVTALDGSKFNLDAMGGRVVLIDFWATWCGPCNEELPHMRKIAQEFAGQPLVISSVSWDSDEAKWKDFVAKNGMTWVQYRDADKNLTNAFGVEAIPHYFTIDSDGVLTTEMVGSGSNVEGKLKKLLARSREAQKQTAAASPVTAHVPGN